MGIRTFKGEQATGAAVGCRDPVPGSCRGLGRRRRPSTTGSPSPTADPTNRGAAGGSERVEREGRGHKVYTPSLAPR